MVATMENFNDGEKKFLVDLFIKARKELVAGLIFESPGEYLGDIGELSSPAAIRNDTQLQAQSESEKYLSTIDKAIHHLDDMKQALAGTSKEGADRLYTDRTNFKNFGNIVLEELAKTTGDTITPNEKATWDKFMNAMVDALN
ncbi:hemoglobin subunit beta-3-like [Rana temporaria]|uniref:hemoglobin subunit beta-3-like n=1 Tax=Rana temporaria TaxID=8407 RepID=UPI001AAD0CBE|nr:hemoglobin subunit beta-3-like [Rana temporaria]